MPFGIGHNAGPPLNSPIPLKGLKQKPSRAVVSEQSLEQQHLDYAAAANLAARSDTKLRGKWPRLVYQDAWQEAGTGGSQRVTNAAQVVGMTEFPQDLRHYCRNPRCRSKLPSRISNPREAFCTRGCYESFYLKRCRVCEQPLEAKYRKIKNGGDRTKFVRVQNSAQTCGSAECKRRWRERDGTGRFSAPKQAYGYQGSQKSDLRKEAPVPQALFCAIQTPKWRQVAGPPLTPNQFHCATVADGPDGKWKDGGFERIEAKNRAALKAAQHHTFKNRLRELIAGVIASRKTTAMKRGMDG